MSSAPTQPPRWRIIAGSSTASISRALPGQGWLTNISSDREVAETALREELKRKPTGASRRQASPSNRQYGTQSARPSSVSSVHATAKRCACACENNRFSDAACASR